MNQAVCTDKVFIETFKTLQSTRAVSKELGVSEGNIRKRRRRIEKKYGISLPQFDSRPKYNTATISDDRIEVRLEIQDGVIIVGGDAHYWPGWVPTMHRAYVYLAKKLKPFACIDNGDSFDGANVSRFPDIGHEAKPAVADEIANLQDRKYEIIKASPGSKKIWNLGNHCLRYETFLAARVPEYKRVKGMHLKDHFPEWIPSWFVTVNGGTESHTEIRHREKGGVHAGYNNVLHSGVNIVTGHDHRADVVPFNDRRGRRWAVRTGMMADSCRDGPFVSYIEGKTTNWQSALAVLTYRNGKLLAPEHCWREDDDHVQFRGEIIKV